MVQPLGAGGGEGGEGAAPPVGVQALVDALLDRVRLPAGAAPAGPGGGSGSGGTGAAAAAGREPPSKQPPSPGVPFLFYIDHCYAITGQGTVMTGGWVRRSVAGGASTGAGVLRRVRSGPSEGLAPHPGRADAWRPLHTAQAR